MSIIIYVLGHRTHDEQCDHAMEVSSIRKFPLMTSDTLSLSLVATRIQSIIGGNFSYFCVEVQFPPPN